jgi:ribosomal protein S18 acetylase RimI-like enzyme
MVPGVDLRLRESTLSDTAFLKEMLYEAVFWRAGDDGPSPEEALEYPEVAKSLADWGRRAGDTAVVATVDSSPAGTAWYRFWTVGNHIRGYVDEATPVLVIGVRREYRRRGIGGMLIDSLADRASEQGIERLSLSVSKDNFALHLYRQRGFLPCADLGNSLLMVRRIDP